MNRRNCSVSSFIRVLHRGMEIDAMVEALLSRPYRAE